MAEKQNQDSLVNTQDDEEWTKTETPVTPELPPVSPVKPPSAPDAIAVTVLPQPIYVISYDPLVAAAERRTRIARIHMKCLLFMSNCIAFVSFCNLLDLFYMNYNTVPDGVLTFVVLRSTVGLLGILVLSTNKLPAVAAYALAWLVVYASWSGYFQYMAHTYQLDKIMNQCTVRGILYNEPYLECVDRMWLPIRDEGILWMLYACVGFSVTTAYVRCAIRANVSGDAKKEREEAKAAEV